jgi:hypothetical protein
MSSRRLIALLLMVVAAVASIWAIDRRVQRHARPVDIAAPAEQVESAP